MALFLSCTLWSGYLSLALNIYLRVLPIRHCSSRVLCCRCYLRPFAVTSHFSITVSSPLPSCSGGAYIVSAGSKVPLRAKDLLPTLNSLVMTYFRDLFSSIRGLSKNFFSFCLQQKVFFVPDPASFLTKFLPLH